MNIDELLEKLHFGTHYYRAPTPLPDAWPSDLEKCHAMGFDFVQVRVFWRWCERKEGVYYWDDLDRFMRLAAEKNCKVVFQLSLENAPEYIFRKYDGYRIDIRGNRIYPYSHAAFYAGGWIPCFDNPDVMAHALMFVEHLVLRYRNDPVLAFYHAWNEPRCRPLGECACTHSIKSYQNYLREKFGTIERLNDFLGRCWGDFDQIDAARDTGDYADMYLWRQWGASRVRDRVGKVAQLLKKLDPDRAVISHVGCSAIIQDPLNDISDDLLMNDATDLYGTSFPTRIMPEYTPYLLVDYLRYAAHGKFSVYEIYPSNSNFLQEIPPGQVQQWVWICIAGGAKLLALWQYRKERLGMETEEAGLVECDGRSNPTSCMMEETLQKLKPLCEELVHCHVPAAQAALVFDQQSDLLGRIENTVPRSSGETGMFPLGVQYPGGWPVKGDVLGLYHLLHRGHYAVDFTAPQRWNEEDLSRYKIIFACGLEIVDEERLEKLNTFVRQGGILIVDAIFARRMSNTWLQATRPGAGADALWGFREAECLLMNRKIWNFSFPGQKSVPAMSLRMEYEVEPGTEVLGRWEDTGSPAVVRRKIGKGQVIAFGSVVGFLAGQEEKWFWHELTLAFGGQEPILALAPWGAVLDRLMSMAGVGRSGYFNTDCVMERTLITPNREKLHFAFRCFDGGARLDDAAWGALSRPDAELIVSLSDVKIWRASENMAEKY